MFHRLREIMRFFSKDTVKTIIEDPLSLNLYSYFKAMTLVDIGLGRWALIHRVIVQDRFVPRSHCGPGVCNSGGSEHTRRDKDDRRW